MIQATLLEIGIAVAVCVGGATSTFFWTRGHYIDQFDTLKAQLTQAAKDEQKQIDEEVKNNTTVTKEQFSLPPKQQRLPPAKKSTPTAA